MIRPMVEKDKSASEGSTNQKADQEQQINLDMEHWNDLKKELLLKYGFPENMIKKIHITIAQECHDNYRFSRHVLCLLYESGDILKHENFTNEEELEKACQKIAHLQKTKDETKKILND